MPWASSGSAFSCGFGWLARVWGAIASILMMVFGVLSITACLSWAVYMMFVGFFLVLIEASFMASMFGATECAKQVDSILKYWHKAGLYILLAMPPPFMCFGLRTLVGAGAVFVAGGFYFVLAIGGKGASDDMIVRTHRGEDKEFQVQLIKNTDDNPPVVTKEPVPEPAKPKLTLSSSQPQADTLKPAFTGSVPADIPPAFPESFGERTIPFTGTVGKLTVQLSPRPLPAVSSSTSSSSMGPRTIPYTGPLATVPPVIPPPPGSQPK